MYKLYKTIFYLFIFTLFNAQAIADGYILAQKNCEIFLELPFAPTIGSTIYAIPELDDPTDNKAIPIVIVGVEFPKAKGKIKPKNNICSNIKNYSIVANLSESDELLNDASIPERRGRWRNVIGIETQGTYAYINSPSKRASAFIKYGGRRSRDLGFGLSAGVGRWFRNANQLPSDYLYSKTLNYWAIKTYYYSYILQEKNLRMYLEPFYHQSFSKNLREYGSEIKFSYNLNTYFRTGIAGSAFKSQQKLSTKNLPNINITNKAIGYDCGLFMALDY